MLSANCGDDHLLLPSMGTNPPREGLVLSEVFLHLLVAVVLKFPQVFEHEPREFCLFVFIPADVCTLSTFYYSA